MAGTGDATNGASKAGTASAVKPAAPPPPANPEVAEVDRILQLNLSLAIHADSTSKVIKLDDAESIISSVKASENGGYQAGRGRPVAPEDSAEGDRFGSTRQQQESADGQSDAGPPVDPNDPWSSLQTAYRIKGDKNAKGGASANGASKGPAMAAAGRGSSRTRLSRPNSSKQQEELVLLDDEEAGGLVVKQPQPLYGAQTRSFRQPPKATKQNGWGQGEFAAAGTLMLGDEQLSAIAPPGASTGNYWDEQRQQEEKALPVPKQPKQTDDLAFEDVEDFDALLEQEFNGMGIANPDLAAKLAAFEAQQDDD